jgi:hypothetical protein
MGSVIRGDVPPPTLFRDGRPGDEKPATQPAQPAVPAAGTMQLPETPSKPYVLKTEAPVEGPQGASSHADAKAGPVESSAASAPRSTRGQADKSITDSSLLEELRSAVQRGKK